MGRHRRTPYDALKPIAQPTWLVVRDQHHTLLEQVELAPLTHPAEVLASAMERFEKDGWIMEEEPSRSFAGFFCRRDGDRWLVHISRGNPLTTGSGEQASPWNGPAQAPSGLNSPFDPKPR